MSGAAEPPTDLHWLEVQVRAMYVHDARGRITAFNEPPGKRADTPVFFFGRTRHGNLWRFRADLPDALVRELARLAALEPTDADLDRMPDRLPVMRARIEEQLGAAVEIEWSGPAWRFPGAPPEPAAGPGELRALGAGDEALLPGFPRLAPRLGAGPFHAIVEDDRAVSVCYCATAPPAPGSPWRGLEAGVDTLEPRRGRGLAPRVVLAWAREVRARGWWPLYSTSFDNRASRAVARKLGLVRYGSDHHFR